MNVKNAKQNITSQGGDLLEYYTIWVKCHVPETSRDIIHLREKIKSQNTHVQGMSYDMSESRSKYAARICRKAIYVKVSCTLSFYSCLKFLLEGGMYIPNPLNELAQAFVMSAVYPKCLFILRDARA